MYSVRKLIFSLLRFELFGKELDEETKNLITIESFSALYKISKAHDLVHLVGDALDKNGFLPADTDARKAFLTQRSMAVYRYEQIQYELEEICRVLEEAHIQHIPLKGSVLRKYYPEPWMRTSCDIDILVHEEDLDKASGALCNELHYENKGKGSHDMQFFAQNGVHLELHYNLIEDSVAPASDAVLSKIWDMTVPKDGWEYRKEMTDEAFYFYHVAHMAKHFVHGGCGVRPFLDLKILDEKVEYNAKRDKLLEEGKLLTFTNAAKQLAAVWFDGQEHTPLTQELENFILQGGVYGTLENKVAVQQTKKGGKFRYALSRIWLPYNSLKFHYPSLQKHKWLYPFFQVRRWFKLLFKGGAKRSVRELSANANMTDERQQRTSALLNDLGL